MDQPWGLSGPQFLALYAMGFAGALVVMFVVQALLARVGPRGVGADVRLDVYEAAYLAGGPHRLVDTAVAALALRDKVLVNRRGRLTPVEGATPNDPVEAAVGGVVRQTMSRGAVHRRMRNHPAVLAIDERLRSQGLLLDGSRARLWRLAVVLPVAVFLVGVVRAINGMNLHRPTGNLLVLLSLSFVVVFWVLARRLAVRYRPSSAGRAALRVLRKEHRARDGRNGSVDLQLAGVAVLGYAAIADPTLRTSLIGSNYSSSGGDSGGGCGGGGCGGGGCGGGGCGG
ncbi:MAG TPA: TIGR04222 domain-containing membrane protein [Actinophytocola sp.]|jgi:uncharacterized protein (TIGR04222 family)|uniref:TIGR04222 domain-containing membrane protein n=1 Tax=Actinophytocola sp. TaxID=1872138 RepID=UPI002E09744A|nr:TIGR04222 domain-containing membrane protein [Actinophytocola sp.]